MFQLAAPLGLLALGGLVAPILIHLVRRPLRVVRVGNLDLLQGERRPTRSLRWHEWPLLALRCTILAALALSLAGVRWQPAAPRAARWLLRVPGATLDATARAEWEQFRAQGFEPRVLSAGFPRDSSAEHDGQADVDAWSLLRETDQRLPRGSRIVVFGPTWATQFRGTRPALAHVEVSWHATTGKPPAAAVAKAPGVGIVAARDREEDARYLRAAFAAMGVSVVTTDAPDWIFRLGDVALPPGWNERVQKGAHLVTDAPDAAPRIKVDRWFDVDEIRVPLRQRVVLNEGVPLRRDSAGEPWITEAREGAGRHWRFALRFHPDWSDWPVETAFPAWWREQLMPAQRRDVTVAEEEAAPRFAPMTAATEHSPATAGYGAVDLRGWCWVIAAMLFGVERALSRSVRQRRING